MIVEIEEVIYASSIIAAAVVLSLLIGHMLRVVATRLYSQTVTELDDAILNSFEGPIRAAIILAGLQAGLRRISALWDAWHGLLDSLFFILFLLVAFVMVHRLISGLADLYGKEVTSRTKTELDEKFLSFFRALANIRISIIALIVLLGHFGIEPSAFVATLGIGSLAVALAAKETLSDIIAGYMILRDQPFAIGDGVELLDIDTWVDVTEIGLFSTRILTRDNRMVTVPNAVIGKGLIVNYSDPDTVYRVQTHVGLALAVDVEKARGILVNSLASEDWVMKERPIEALMLSIGDSALVFRVRCWIENYMDTRRVIDKMNTTIYHALNNGGIEMAMPSRQIYLQGPTVAKADEFRHVEPSAEP
jgi:small-conductance mechanosensitive channel